MLYKVSPFSRCVCLLLPGWYWPLFWGCLRYTFYRAAAVVLGTDLPACGILFSARSSVCCRHACHLKRMISPTVVLYFGKPAMVSPLAIVHGCCKPPLCAIACRLSISGNKNNRMILFMNGFLVTRKINLLRFSTWWDSN